MSPSSNDIARDNLRALSLENSNFRKFTVEKETGKLIKVNGAIEWIIRLIKNIFTAGGEDKKVHDIYQKNMLALGKTPLSDREFTVSKLKANFLSEKINDLVNRPKADVVDEEVIVPAANTDILADFNWESLHPPAAPLNTPEVEEVIVPAANTDILADFNWESLKVVSSLVKRLKNTNNQIEFLTQIANLAIIGNVYRGMAIDIDQNNQINQVIGQARADDSEVKTDRIVYHLGSLTELEVDKKMNAWINKAYDNPKPSFEPSTIAAIKAGIILRENIDILKNACELGEAEFSDYGSVVLKLQLDFSRAYMALEQLLRMDNFNPTIGAYRQQAAGFFDADTEQTIEKIQSKHTH